MLAEVPWPLQPHLPRLKACGGGGGGMGPVMRGWVRVGCFVYLSNLPWATMACRLYTHGPGAHRYEASSVDGSRPSCCHTFPRFCEVQTWRFDMVGESIAPHRPARMRGKTHARPSPRGCHIHADGVGCINTGIDSLRKHIGPWSHLAIVGFHGPLRSELVPGAGRVVRRGHPGLTHLHQRSTTTRVAKGAWVRSW